MLSGEFSWEEAVVTALEWRWLLASALTLALAHGLFRLTSPREQPLQAFDGAATSPLRNAGSSQRGVVVVTGGTGFLGSAIVRQLVQRHAVTVIDRALPSAARRVDGVEYLVADLAFNIFQEGGPGQMTQNFIYTCFKSADAVLHVAGCVCLMDNPGLLHNAHVVATANVVRCARLAGVKALVYTSSGGAVTSPFLKEPQLRVPCDLVLPAEFPFASHYSRTKYQAERLALSANSKGFAACALRLPGLYGLGDSLIVDPLLSGLMTHVPYGGDDCLIDFCYVENAAHAHCIALEALLAAASSRRHRQVAGRAFNVTNGESETAPVVPMWNQLLHICRPEARPLQPLPYPVAYAIACATEAVDWFTAGRVPCPGAAIWSLTRASLGYATTAVTLQLSDDLGYQPLFTTEQSFHDIKQKLRQQEQEQQQPPPSGSDASGARSSGRGTDAKSSVRSSSGGGSSARKRRASPSPSPPPPTQQQEDSTSGSPAANWALPPLSTNPAQRILDRLSGPAPTLAELILTACGLVFGLAVRTCLFGAISV
jgi:sterol-4alpha-carboxylate 3-dehydrogenase (decarboxylating)